MADEKKPRRPRKTTAQTPGIADRSPAAGIVAVRLGTEASRTGHFVSFLQGPLTNRLAELSTYSRRSPVVVDELANRATLSTEGEKTSLSLFLNDYSLLTAQVDAEGNRKVAAGMFKTSTKKLLDALISEFSRKNVTHSASPNLEVSIPLSVYLDLLGKTNTRSNLNSLRNSVMADLQTLFAASLRWNDASGDYIETRLISAHGIKNSVIHVTLSPTLGAYLTNSFRMMFNAQSFALDERNPSAYAISRKLQLAWHMNNKRRLERGEYFDVISVEALLVVCSELPSLEEVKSSSDRHVGRIIIPFHRALEQLLAQGILIEYAYISADGKNLGSSAPKQEDFFSAYLRYTLNTPR